MNNRNNSIPLNEITSRDVNDNTMRCLVKTIALHGLGLYVYEGEALPNAEKEAQEKAQRSKQKAEAMKMLDDATTSKEVAGIWAMYKSLQADAEFKEKVVLLGNKYKAEEGK